MTARHTIDAAAYRERAARTAQYLAGTQPTDAAPAGLDPVADVDALLVEIVARGLTSDERADLQECAKAMRMFASPSGLHYSRRNNVLADFLGRLAGTP